MSIFTSADDARALGSSQQHVLAAGSGFIVFVFVVRVYLRVLRRNAIALGRPGAEINELAALRTKRPIAIALPSCVGTAGWTFDRLGHAFSTL